MERPHPLSPVVKGWIGFVAIMLIQGRDYLEHLGDRHPDGGGMGWLVLGGVVLAYLALTTILGYFSWRFTRFVVDDHQLRIEHNFIWHTSDQVPFTKIQSVDVVQPFAARLLRLAQVRIDVGSGRPKTIEYLGRERAYQMRDYLVVRAHGRTLTVAESARTPTAGALSDVAAHETVLLTVRWPRLVLAALLSTDFLVTLLLALAVAVAMVMLHQWGLAAVLVPLATSVTGTIGKHVVQQWNYSLVRSGQALKVTRGMTSLVSQTLPTNRIQGIIITQHLLWRPLGLHRVRIDVLGYRRDGQNDRAASDILLPVGTWPQVQAALDAVWPGFQLDQVLLHRPPRRARWLDPFAWGWLAWGMTDDVFVGRTGWLIRRTRAVHHARIQSVHLRQGPVQRRLHLATVELNTSNSSGDVRALHLAEPTARDIVLAEMDQARAARQRDAVRRALDALPAPRVAEP